MKSLVESIKENEQKDLFKQIANTLEKTYTDKKFKWNGEALFIDGNFVVNPNRNDLLSSLYELCNALKSELKGYN